MRPFPDSEYGWQGSWRKAPPLGMPAASSRVAVQPANGGEVEFWLDIDRAQYRVWFVPDDRVRGPARTGRVEITLHSNPTPPFLPVLGGFSKGGFSYWPIKGVPVLWQDNWRGR